MSKLGHCYCCGKKISYQTANNAFRYEMEMRQISAVFGHQTSKKETWLHLPVCAVCCEKPDLQKIEQFLKDGSDVYDQVDFKLFKRFEVDPVEGGKRI